MKTFWRIFEIIMLLFLLFIFIIATITGGSFLIHILFNIPYYIAFGIWLMSLISFIPILLFLDSKNENFFEYNDENYKHKSTD